jgi:hypothetical protein
MNKQTVFLAGAVLLALHFGNLLWRRRRAREIAERWLAQHNYRVTRFRQFFLAGWGKFPATPFRNNDWAVNFLVEVDDLKLGGSGEVRLRVWTDWLGMIDREPEISWVRMPNVETGGALTPEMQWENAQIAILRRVNSGETTLRPQGRDPEARADFDTMVEHILALQRRGLLHCATPIADLRSNAQYAEVADVVLTDEGRRAVANADASQSNASAR